jgi:hypothetical protein
MTASGESPDSRAPSAGTRLARRILVVIAALGVVVAVVSTLALRRVRVSAQACAGSCHAGQLHPAVRPGHEAVACQACHQTPAATALSLWVRSFVSSRASAMPHATVDAGACVSCHETLPSWRGVAATAGHYQHAPPGEHSSCVRCHASSTHGKASIDAICGECHDEDRLHPKSQDAETCQSCHAFVVREPNERGPANPCLVCHGPSSPQAKREAGAARTAGADLLHGSVDCRLCHQPHHGSRRAGGPPSESGGGAPAGAAVPAIATRTVAARLCHECHEIQFGAKLEGVPSGHLECDGCHQQHQPRDRALETCRDCHSQAVPDPDGESEAQQHDSCVSCHVPHEWTAERSACVRCHVDKATSLLTRSPSEHETCTQCHAVHGPLPTGERCTECHTDKAAHVRVAPPRHRHCASCHDPHAASELPRDVCASCHKPEVGQLATQGPRSHARNGCPSCHTPHGSPLPGQQVCVRCHEEQGRLVTEARPEQHQSCASCHAPHRFSVSSVSAACSRCHQATLQGAEAHRGECDSCHTPHGSPAVSTAECRQCHQQIQATRSRPGSHHGECAGCHVPHAAAGAAATKCQGCHQAQQRVAASWPKDSPHAGRCGECHKPHEPQRQPQCGACHQDQARAATGGKHQCVQCHPPHRQAASSTAGWWDRCSSCHAAQSKASQSSGASAHRVCSNCHAQHAFKPPACSSCHAPNTLKAGHQIPEHGSCDRCHQSHEASKPARRECTSCHQDKLDHHPEAPKCVACHAFR